MRKHLCLLGLVFVTSLSVKAATGCVANADPSTIYLAKQGSFYRADGASASLGGGCNWNFQYPLSGCNVNSGIGAGYLAVDSPQDCPIDDHIYVMIIALLVSGVYFYKNGYLTINPFRSVFSMLGDNSLKR